MSKKKYNVQTYAPQLSMKYEASIACLNHIFNVHHEHRIKGVFANSSQFASLSFSAQTEICWCYKRLRSQTT
jgi:hypothetical protein